MGAAGDWAWFAGVPKAPITRNLPTGEIEVEVTTCEVLNPAKPLPFMINKDEDTDENVRLKYRYLDLRRERCSATWCCATSDQVHARLPGRARLHRGRNADPVQDHPGRRARLPGAYSRHHPGSFYALPQSPQQLKQLLMVAGFERYFQIARCFRDEDLRGDRQPEFTQLDLEMSFVHRDDVLAMVEGLFTAMMPAVAPHKKLLSTPWPKLSFTEAMERYGTDKPDLRFGLELYSMSAISSRRAALWSSRTRSKPVG